MGRYEAYARLSLGLAFQLAGELASAEDELQRARALFDQSGDVGPHAVAEGLLCLIQRERGDDFEPLRRQALQRVDGLDEEAAARSVHVLCGVEPPGPTRDSYDWMAAKAVEAWTARSQTAPGSS